tara:strand:+ start:376 stop:639 length:264 start_codon:yes stop_codon:yes gene_type:complete
MAIKHLSGIWAERFSACIQTPVGDLDRLIIHDGNTATHVFNGISPLTLGAFVAHKLSAGGAALEVDGEPIRPLLCGAGLVMLAEALR